MKTILFTLVAICSTNLCFSGSALAMGECPGHDVPIKDIKGTATIARSEVDKYNVYAKAKTDSFTGYYAIVLSENTFLMCGTQSENDSSFFDSAESPAK